jgi:hypothetical protein
MFMFITPGIVVRNGNHIFSGEIWQLQKGFVSGGQGEVRAALDAAR